MVNVEHFAKSKDAQFMVHEAPTFAARVMQTLTERLRTVEDLITP